MDTSLLRKAGLTESQAKAYLALIEHGELSPAELAETIGESRTNGYMICEKLEILGLASKKESPKALYTPNHPSALETLAEKRRKAITRNEQEVKQGLSPLIDLFYAHTEQPGVRVLQGTDGRREVYNDTLRTNQDIYLVRTRADTTGFGAEFFRNYRTQRAAQGIDTFSLTPLSKEAIQHVKERTDESLRYRRVFMPLDRYTAPVEIDVYGSKTAFIGFGETQMSTIIDSRPVADAMRQLLGLLRDELRPYSDEQIASVLATSD